MLGKLRSELTDEHVNRAIAVRHRVTPDPLIDVVALDDLALGLRQAGEQLELSACQADRRSGYERLELIGADLKLGCDGGA